MTKLFLLFATTTASVLPCDSESTQNYSQNPATQIVEKRAHNFFQILRDHAQDLDLSDSNKDIVKFGQRYKVIGEPRIINNRKITVTPPSLDLKKAAKVAFDPEKFDNNFATTFKQELQKYSPEEQRALAMSLAGAIGDAYGMHAEFAPSVLGQPNLGATVPDTFFRYDSYIPLWQNQLMLPGVFTDDTSMALAMAEGWQEILQPIEMDQNRCYKIHPDTGRKLLLDAFKKCDWNNPAEFSALEIYTAFANSNMALRLLFGKKYLPYFHRKMLKKYSAWRSEGKNSCVGECFDVGIHIGNLLQLSKSYTDKNPYEDQLFIDSLKFQAGTNLGITNSGNGGIMRQFILAPMSMHNKDTAIKLALISSQTTHNSPHTNDCAILLAAMTHAAIHAKGQTVEERKKGILLDHGIKFDDLKSDEVRSLLPQRKHEEIFQLPTWKSVNLKDLTNSGFAPKSLEAAMAIVDRSESFRHGLDLINAIGGDADTVAAIAAPLLVAVHEIESIDDVLINDLAWNKFIFQTAVKMLELGKKNFA